MVPHAYGEEADQTYVVFFTGECTGVVVHAHKDAENPLGDDAGNWAMEEFKPFRGSVTITED